MLQYDSGAGDPPSPFHVLQEIVTMTPKKSPGRTATGQFAKGNPGGPGRPPRHVEVTYMAGLFAACTLDDWTEIVRRAVDDAKQGDAKARDWLASYMVGAAKAPARLFTKMDKERALDERFSSMD